MTTIDEDNAAHLDPRAVEEYFELGASSAFVLLRSPLVRMRIDPNEEKVELTLPAIGADPEVTSFERFSVERFVRESGEEWFRLSIDAADMHYEAYAIAESIVDQLRAGASFRHSVSEALFSFKELLAGRRRLTEERELGVIGELLVLKHVIATSGEEAALGAWLGPLAEEHDFAFAGFDAEIKTTKSESRTHVIGSETQLEPSPGRPLLLVSIQLTPAGRAVQGFTLPSLVSDVRSLLDSGLRTFDSTLKGLDWRENDSDLYRRRYRLRSVPRAYLVDEQFPAITSERLDKVVPKRANVVGVNYRVNVTDLDHCATDSPLDEFCEVPA